jgi:hypothetical protein
MNIRLNKKSIRSVPYITLVAAIVEQDSSLDVLEGSTEEMEELFRLIQDKEKFFASAQRVIDYIASCNLLKGRENL